MRKVAGLLTLLALAFAFSGAAMAANKQKIFIKANKGSNTTGKFSYVLKGTEANAKLAPFKAQNHLSYALNSKIKGQGLSAKKGGYVNGTIDTVQYFNSWFITGSRNSIYPFSMVGQDPTKAVNTKIATRVLPLEIVLTDFNGNPLYDFNPNVATDPQGDDVTLTEQSPLYDASTTYPGPPADTGQIIDTAQRVTFRTSRAGGWHTTLALDNTVQQAYYSTSLDPSAWSYLVDSQQNIIGVAMDINVISSVFESVLQIENSLVGMPNSVVPIILTDYLTAYDPSSGQCCVLGFHSAEPGIANPAGITVWTWATFIPHGVDNGFTSPFGAFGADVMVLSHEVSELVNDPFVGAGGTAVSPWVDGSVSFAQGNLETGDVIEGMAANDVIYNVPLNVGGGYTYSLQNVATLEWFTRNPFNGGIYSWPNEHTLGQAAHGVNCQVPGVCSWLYGQGSAAFYFGPNY